MTEKDSTHKCIRAITSGQQGPKPIPGQPLHEPPASAPTQKTTQETHKCEQCPPISPCTAMNGTEIISNRYSTNTEKKKTAEDYIKQIEDIIAMYKARGDDHASKYLIDVYSLMHRQAFLMNETRQNNNRKLDEADTIWKSTKSSLDKVNESETQKLEGEYDLSMKSLMEKRTSKIKTLEDLSTPVSIKGSLTRLIGAGGITTLLISSQKEITNMIQKYIPDFANFAYLAFLMAAGILVVGTTKLIGAYFEKRLRVTKEGFNNDESEIKRDYNDEKQALIKKQEERFETEYKTYNTEKVEIEKGDFEYRQDSAAHVYFEVFDLCRSFYNSYTRKYLEFSELIDKDPKKAMKFIKNHAEDLAKSKIITSPTKDILSSDI